MNCLLKKERKYVFDLVCLEDKTYIDLHTTPLPESIRSNADGIG